MENLKRTLGLMVAAFVLVVLMTFVAEKKPDLAVVKRAQLFFDVPGKGRTATAGVGPILLGLATIDFRFRRPSFRAPVKKAGFTCCFLLSIRLLLTPSAVLEARPIEDFALLDCAPIFLSFAAILVVMHAERSEKQTARAKAEIKAD